MVDAPVMNEASIDGIEFSLAEGFTRRKCVVLRQALYMLSDDADPQDLSAIFRRNEHRIHQVARRLVSSGFADGPLIIGPWSLRSTSH